MPTELLLVLVVGYAAWRLEQRLHVPAAVLLVIVGMVLGPAQLAWVTPHSAAGVLGQLGIALLLGLAGMQLGVERIARAGLSGIRVAVLGIGLSWVFGYFVATAWGSPSAEALYVGLALSATSVGITAHVLVRNGLMNHRIGEIVMAAAVIDDLLVLYLLAAAHGSLSGEIDTLRTLASVVAGIALLAAVFWSGRCLFSLPTRYLPEPGSFPELAAIILFIVVASWASEMAGMSHVVGALFAGLGIRSGYQVRSTSPPSARLEPVVHLLAPFFFVLLGSRADWKVLADPGMPQLFAALLAAALSAKLLSGVIGADGSCNRFARALVGIGMAPRGEVALVIAGIGFAQGHVSHHLLVILILVSLACTTVIPPAMQWLAHLHRRTARHRP